MGYFTPTAVQMAVYKPVSEGKDLMVQSRTGTGKTTAFGLPTISKLIPAHRQPQALILCPTRELALQVSRELSAVGKNRGIVVETLYGGAPIGKQITALKNGVHIVVGTPGRVLDHIGRRTFDTSAIGTFILDECDEMLSMGFLEDIERVVSHLPDKKQTLLFSATMPDEVARYSRRHMKNPEIISLSRDTISVSDIHHAYYIVSGIARSRDLLKIIYAEEPESAIIFCNMRDETTMVARFLQKQGLDAEPLSSDLSQNDRERVMNRMKAKNLRFLCATDVAARGIDISNLTHVINYSVPEQPEIYVHRTGRTGRAGKKGTALSMVGPRELGNFRYVRLTFGIKPEERLLPKDDIFIGKLKVPLPTIGTPQPPDPVQILIRGVTSPTEPTDLEKKIFEKLLASQSGKRVLTQLVADKLNQLSTKAKPRRERVAASHDGDGATAGAPASAAYEDRGERKFEDRPRRFDGGGDRGDRPRREGGERGSYGGDRAVGDRPRRESSERGGYGHDRPRREGSDRGGPGGDRPPWRDREGGGGRDRHDRDRSQPPAVVEASAVVTAEGTAPSATAPEMLNADAPTGRVERTDGDRPRRDYRDRDRGGRDGGGRDRYESRGDRAEGDRSQPPARPDGDRPHRTDGDRSQISPRPESDRPHRTDGDRGGRDRDRGGRDRDRGERPAPMVREDRTEAPPIAVAGTEIAPVVEVETVAKVDDVARAALERADRGDKKGGKKTAGKTEPTTETREFWETWAEEKSTRSPEAAPAAAADAAPAAEEPGGRGRGRDRGGRGRGDKPARGARAEAAAEKTETADKPERSSRAKRDTTVAPPPVAAADGSQARLFISLGKKHGVSADDLRSLLAGPIGGDKARIGSVSLRDSHAHVRVPEDLVDAIIAGVHGTQHNKHDVTVERARA